MEFDLDDILQGAARPLTVGIVSSRTRRPSQNVSPMKVAPRPVQLRGRSHKQPIAAKAPSCPRAASAPCATAQAA